MPPPPLTDDEVRQRVLVWWEDRYEAFGIDSNTDGLPDQAASQETWLEILPAIYRRERERAYRFGLAEDALASILAKLEAPENPDQRMKGMLTRDYEQHVDHPLREICGGQPIRYSWETTWKPGWHFYLFVVLFFGMGIYPMRFNPGLIECILILIYLISSLIYAARRMKKPDKNWMDWRVTPLTSYRNLALQVQKRAQQQAELMQEAAGRHLLARQRCQQLS